MLKRIGMWNWNFVVGNELHTFLEHHYKKTLKPEHSIFNPEVSNDVLRTPVFIEKREFWQLVFPTYCQLYHQIYPSEQFSVEGVEMVQCRTYRGINFTGKIDLCGRKKNAPMIADNKSTSNLDILGDKLHQNFQFLFYFWLSGLEEGEFMVNRIKKPAQRQGKKESSHDFAYRCVDEIKAEPEKYFAREWTYFTKEEMQKFEQSILDPKVSKLLRILEGKPEDSFIWQDKALGACNNYNTSCPFMPLCFDDEALATVEYEQKSSKHEELEVE